MGRAFFPRFLSQRFVNADSAFKVRCIIFPQMPPGEEKHNKKHNTKNIPRRRVTALVSCAIVPSTTPQRRAFRKFDAKFLWKGGDGRGGGRGAEGAEGGGFANLQEARPPLPVCPLLFPSQRSQETRHPTQDSEGSQEQLARCAGR